MKADDRAGDRAGQRAWPERAARRQLPAEQDGHRQDDGGHDPDAAGPRDTRRGRGDRRDDRHADDHERRQQ
jgi:hypothetical protein